MNNKRVLTIALICLSLLVGSTIFIGMANGNAAFAADKQDMLTPEQYTDSDYLINSDGTLNNKKSIRDFAKEVSAAKNNDEILNMAQVFPVQYLNSDEEITTFAYMGKEYGFYIYKDGKLFYILLIDFVYTNNGAKENTDIEYKIRLEPILQQCFYRFNVGTDYGFTKHINNYDLYIANPRFMTSLYNENALNYGDAGYSKQNDDGLIISQARFNYSKVGLATKQDYKNAVSRIVVDKVFDIGCDALNAVTCGIGGTVLQAIKNIVETTDDLFNVGKESILKADNENNIVTEMSRTAQLYNPSLDHFSRGIASVPQQNIVLSTTGESYAEFITVVNDSNYRSRLVEICEFDVVFKAPLNEFKYLTSPNDNTSFMFYKEEILFDNQKPYFEIKNESIESKDIPVYLLPDGSQKITFSPRYSGLYSFTVPEATTLTLNGTEASVFRLNAGVTYEFDLKNTLSNKKIISNLSCVLENYCENTTYSFESGSRYIIKYQAGKTEYIKLQALNPNLKIGLLDERLNLIESADYSCVFTNFVNGKTYYLLLVNDTNQVQTTQLDFGLPAEMFIATDYCITPQERVLTFQNDSNDKQWYKLQLINHESGNVKIMDERGNALANAGKTDGYITYYTFTLGSYESCYICFDRADGSTTARIDVSSLRFRWIIDNVEINGFNIRLEPGEYTIRGEISVNGEEFKNINEIAIYPIDSRVYINAGILHIGKVDNSTQIYLTPENTASFTLIIVVDDMYRTIRLNHNGGGGYDEPIIVKLNEKISTNNIAMPTRPGYTFLGYYITKQDSGISGKQYITANMNGLVWDLDIDNATLYAHWKQNEYKLTLFNSDDSISYVYTMVYGQSMPERPFAPKRDGYYFKGYFTEPNGKGEKYYSELDDLVDDTQSANIYGYNHYYVEGMIFCYSDNLWLRESDLILYAHWEIMTCTYYSQHLLDGQGNCVTSTRLYLKHGVSQKITAPEKNADGPFSHFILNGKKITSSTITWTPSLIRHPGTGEIRPTVDLFMVFTKSCVAEGTLITLADGKQVPVETLTGNEKLLVWNMLTGKFDTAKLLFVDHDAASVYNVINLSFSDGTSVKVISEHGFWDFDLNKYVYLDKDASQYIGHWFNKQVTDGMGMLAWTKVQLTGVTITQEYTTAWSPVTESHLCYYVNGMLSMPGGISGLFNIFEVDGETLQYDQAAMQADIEKYGLFTYEEFAELLPVPIEMFEAVNGQYLKVAIGKGLIDIETLERLVSRYADFFVTQ